MDLHRHEGSPPERDDFLRALGRFVVAFSRLRHTLEFGICGALQWAGDPRTNAETYHDDVFSNFNGAMRMRLTPQVPPSSTWPRDALAALSKTTASKVIEVHAAVFEVYGRARWDEQDRHLVKAFYKELGDIRELRNRLMHDAWSVLGENSIQVSDRSEPSYIASRRREETAGPQVTMETAGDLDGYVKDIERLINLAVVVSMVQHQPDPHEGDPEGSSLSQRWILGPEGRRVVPRQES